MVNDLKKIVVEGHRGFCAVYPENTLISYAAALDLGVDCFEFDIWLSKDGVPVLMHDGNTKRITGYDKDLRDMTLREIKTLDAGVWKGEQFKGEKIPTFRELLALVRDKRPDCLLGIEIKEYTEETVDITMKYLAEFGVSLSRCWFYCFNARIIRYLKVKYNARTMGYPDFQMKEFEDDSYKYYDEIGISMGIMTPELCEKFRKMGFPMHMYCADNEADVIRSIENGASLITANDPRPLMKYLGRL